MYCVVGSFSFQFPPHVYPCAPRFKRTISQPKDHENPLSIKKIVRTLFQSKDWRSKFFQEPSLSQMIGVPNFSKNPLSPKRSLFLIVLRTLSFPKDRCSEFFQEPSLSMKDWGSDFTRIVRRSCGFSFYFFTYLSTSLQEWLFHL